MLRRVIGERIELVTALDPGARCGSGRRRPDAAGAHQPGHERARRDARRRHADDPHEQRRSRRRRRSRSLELEPGGMSSCGRGSGQRNDARGQRPDLRPLLHDQGRRQGHGTRAFERLRDRQAERRPHRGRERAGPGEHLRQLPAGSSSRRARPRRAGAAGPAAGAQRGASGRRPPDPRRRGRGGRADPARQDARAARLRRRDGGGSLGRAAEAPRARRRVRTRDLRHGDAAYDRRRVRAPGRGVEARAAVHLHVRLHGGRGGAVRRPRGRSCRSHSPRSFSRARCARRSSAPPSRSRSAGCP